MNFFAALVINFHEAAFLRMDRIFALVFMYCIVEVIKSFPVRGSRSHKNHVLLYWELELTFVYFYIPRLFFTDDHDMRVNPKTRHAVHVLYKLRAEVLQTVKSALSLSSAFNEERT